MKPLHFSKPASDELTEAIRWYESRRAGLGGDFYDAVVKTTELIRAHPEAGSRRTARSPARQLPAGRFPFVVVYRVRERDVYIVAVAHTGRRPGYWQDRSK